MPFDALEPPISRLSSESALLIQREFTVGLELELLLVDLPVSRLQILTAESVEKRIP